MEQYDFTNFWMAVSAIGVAILLFAIRRIANEKDQEEPPPEQLSYWLPSEDWILLTAPARKLPAPELPRPWEPIIRDATEWQNLPLKWRARHVWNPEPRFLVLVAPDRRKARLARLQRRLRRLLRARPAPRRLKRKVGLLKAEILRLKGS